MQGFLFLRLEKNVENIEIDMRDFLRREKDSIVKMKLEK